MIYLVNELHYSIKEDAGIGSFITQRDLILEYVTVVYCGTNLNKAKNAYRNVRQSDTVKVMTGSYDEESGRSYFTYPNPIES